MSDEVDPGEFPKCPKCGAHVPELSGKWKFGASGCPQCRAWLVKGTGPLWALPYEEARDILAQSTRQLKAQLRQRA